MKLSFHRLGAFLKRSKLLAELLAEVSTHLLQHTQEGVMLRVLLVFAVHLFALAFAQSETKIRKTKRKNRRIAAVMMQKRTRMRMKKMMNEAERQSTHVR